MSTISLVDTTVSTNEIFCFINPGVRPNSTSVQRVMVKKSCISKTHFAKCVTNVEGRPAKVTWKCDHCGKHVISGVFKAAYARIHLAAEKTNGLCSILCDATDDHARGRREQFRKLIIKLEKEKQDRKRKMQQQAQRIEMREAVAGLQAPAKKTKLTQPKLEAFLKANDAAAADLAVAQWAIAHDIAPNTMQGVYWKQMNKKIAAAPASYTPMYPKKIFETMLPILKEQADAELASHLRHRPTVGRTITGDSATKKVPLINFLVHVPGKGVQLLDITDCTSHMSEGGIKDAM